MKSSYRFYRGCYRIARVLLGIVYGFGVKGKENIPEGATMICANHSSIYDPFFIAFAFGIENHIHIIAKAELYKIPILSTIIQKLCAIKVDRGILDVNTVKETFSYLNKGERVAIFPEGTRRPVENTVTAKSGAIKIAEHAKVPIVPVYIPRKKPLFSKITLVIGEPYLIEKPNYKRTSDDYAQLADTLMSKIEAMNPNSKSQASNIKVQKKSGAGVGFRVSSKTRGR